MAFRILNKKHGVSAEKFIKDEAISFDKKFQRRHELLILTCYINFGQILSFIRELRKICKIKNVKLAFDYAEIFKLGHSETIECLNICKETLQKVGIDFEWKALMCPRLMHGKGYAIIQKSKEQISGGVVLITSANFTKSGFAGENLEIGYSARNIAAIKEFKKNYEYLCTSLAKDLDSFVFMQDSFLLKFAILSSGVFLHKWSGSISQQIGIRYDLTPHAKERGSIAPELVAVGFEAGDSFSRQVLDLAELPKSEIPKAFIHSFTIETYWGRWCPSDAWDALRETFSGTDEFINSFQNATVDENLNVIKNKSIAIQIKLIEQGLIEPVKVDHLDRWVERIKILRENTRKLEKFFVGYEAHRLPYSVEKQSEILDLFDNMQEAINLSRATNKAKLLVLSVLSSGDSSQLRIDSEGRKAIQEMVR